MSVTDELVAYCFRLGHNIIGAGVPERGSRTGPEHTIWLGSRINETVNWLDRQPLSSYTGYLPSNWQ